MEIFVCGLDGNLLDNYNLKSNSAGIALQENLIGFAKRSISIKEGKDYYLTTSGQNSLKQWESAYLYFTGRPIAPVGFVQAIEKRFRDLLQQKIKEIKLYEDAQSFLKEQKGKADIFVTTTVPLATIPQICEAIGLNNLVTEILARGGVYNQGKMIEITEFDKETHYQYLRTKTRPEKPIRMAISSTKEDIIIAKREGVLSVGLEKIFTKKELVGWGADIVFSDFRELSAYISKLGQHN